MSCTESESESHDVVVDDYESEFEYSQSDAIEFDAETADQMWKTGLRVRLTPEVMLIIIIDRPMLIVCGTYIYT
jgi:hypothetical protein